MNVLTVIRLSLVGLIAFGAAGCDSRESNEAIQRFSDLYYRNAAFPENPSSEAPRVEMRGETREVCPDPKHRLPLTGDHLARDFDLPAGSRIDLAFGVLAQDEFSAPVELIASVSDGTNRRVEARVVVDGSEGHELGRWHATSLDVRELSGRARISLSSASSISGTDLASGAPLARAYFACPIVLPLARDAGSLDVVLISLDTLRADRLGLYGYDRPTSPFMDRMFGDQGVVVEHAYSQATNTLRGHTAMLTGLRPAVAVSVEADGSDRLRGFPTLADRLRNAGYLTAAFTENAYVSNFFGFARGFDVFREDKETNAMDVGEREAKRTFDRAFQWLRENATQRKFVFIHTYQVHDPYAPPSDFAARFPTPPNASPVQANSSKYDAEIAYLDTELGRFLEKLSTLGGLDRTIFIITADHGEEFGEHGGQLHGAHLHDEVLRVPLLFRAPKLLPSGVRRQGPGALVDITPTVLEMLELPVPSYLDGTSLARHLRENEALLPRFIPSEAFTPTSLLLTGKDASWLSPSIALTRFPLRVIRIRTATGARHEAYHLVNEPTETHNLAVDDALVAPELREMIAEVDGYLGSAARRAADLGERLGIPTDSAVSAPIDPTQLEKLRTLGYLE